MKIRKPVDAESLVFLIVQHILNLKSAEIRDFEPSPSKKRQHKENTTAEYLSITPSDSVFEMELDGILIGHAQN